MQDNLFKYLRAAVIEGLNDMSNEFELATANKSFWRIQNHNDYPKINYFENGFPYFSLLNYEKVDYANLYLKEETFKKFSTWNAYHEFVLQSPEICEHLSIGQFSPQSRLANPKWKEIWEYLHTYFLIGNLCDYYIHKYLFKFNDEIFLEVFNQYLRSFEKTVQIDIYIPLILASFESDVIPLTNNITIEKINLDVQLSRNERTSFTNSTHKLVIGAATHAIIFKNWTITNATEEGRDSALTEVESYREALLLTEQILAAVRLVNPELHTGFAQIIAVPVGWQSSFKAGIRQTFVVSEKNYPLYFENYGWLNSPMKIVAAKDKLIIECYNRLSKTPYLDLACKKLNKACLNSRDDDSIIDIAIALESILTSDSRAEISYRLAVRATLLTKKHLYRNFVPKEIFELCKKIYDFRSSVVHGDKKKQTNKRTIQISQGEVIEINEIAIEFLKHIIRTLVLNYNVKEPKDIDDLLFE